MDDQKSIPSQEESPKEAPSNRKKIIQYGLWTLGFLVFSLALGFFRGSDHGNLPLTDDMVWIQGDREIWEESKKKPAPTIYYYWATWCTVCKANDPFLKASLSPLREKGIRFLSWEEGSLDKERLEAFLKEKNITYPVAMASSRFLEDSRIGGYPTTIFADSRGKVVFVDTGIMNPISFWIRVFILQILS